MKERGISLNTNKFDGNIQKYGGAWQVDLKSIPKELQIKHTNGTHFELAPKEAGMDLNYYQNLLNQVKLFQYNSW